MEQSTSTLHEIRVYGLTAIALAAIVVSAFVGYQVRGIVMHSAANVVASGSTSLVQSSLETSASLVFDASAQERLHTLMKERMTKQDVMGFRVADAEGTVVFSTFDGDVGSSVLSDSRDRKALGGALGFDVVAADSDRAVSSLDDTAFKVYTPLRLGASGDVAGVVETYKRYSEISASVRDAVLVVVIPVLLGVAISSAGLLWVLHRATVEVRHRDAELVSLNDRLHDSMLTLEGQSLGTLQALSAAVDEKDSYTARHSLGVTNWAHLIGIAANLSPEDQATLERAGLLHDIGKIGVPESVLLKPGQLTEEEFALIREHPGAGARILEAIPFLDEIVDVVRYHHERWDGAGYPDGLAGDAIPYLARVLAVADAFDAMTTDRPYRAAMPLKDAREELRACAGAQFDPDVVELFLNGGAPGTA